MQRFNTTAIVLARTDYGEADRILTLLTPCQGKLKAIAKGVRKSKSKLAGGIELFSVSEISYIVGRSDINTLISTRLVKHYGSIVKDLNRTALAYDTIKLINKTTEDQPEEAYFNLLRQGFEALDSPNINLDLINSWFSAQLLKLAGHSPNLTFEKNGQKLIVGQKYDFDYEAMVFYPGKTYNSDQIKFLRLIFSNNKLEILQKIQNLEGLVKETQSLVRLAVQTSAHA